MKRLFAVKSVKTGKLITDDVGTCFYDSKEFAKSVRDAWNEYHMPKDEDGNPKGELLFTVTRGPDHYKGMSNG